jgi:hypothetical protein
MKSFRSILFALAVVAVVPALSLANQAQGSTTPKTAPKAAATHAIAGVVKSVDASSLVITTGAKDKARDMTFVLGASTQKKGTIAAGASVDVRYTTEGGKNTATAVTVQEKKK